ncbi:hypothetical protein LR48_Vigan10g141400 [Vigna angularis]|uniref:Uncharacterized protein n=1 Tax=Phaseolus angularis TaxID=3914 RepID=A0A0L9VKV9_PHAAN|nr:hypothetical protein LR48_Vigan10g141400 [Vigna angularis]
MREGVNFIFGVLQMEKEVCTKKIDNNTPGPWKSLGEGGSRRSHGEARCVQNKGNVQHLGIEEVLGEKWAEGLVQHPAYTQPQRWRVTGGLKTLCLGVKKGGWKEVSRPGAGASRHPSRKDSLILLLAFESRIISATHTRDGEQSHVLTTVPPTFPPPYDSTLALEEIDPDKDFENQAGMSNTFEPGRPSSSTTTLSIFKEVEVNIPQFDYVVDDYAFKDYAVEG